MAEHREQTNLWRGGGGEGGGRRTLPRGQKKLPSLLASADHKSPLAMLCTPNCCSVDGLAGSKRPAGRVGVYIATGAVGWGSWLADVLSAVLSTLPRLVLFVCLINNM
jgi:hypothetical protein